MSISIICPIYKGEQYISNLDASIKKQKNVDIKEILYVVTKTKDDSSIDILEGLGATYYTVTPKEYSHSLTREQMAYKASGDILVFITQDIIIDSDVWLYNLTKDIQSGKCEAAFSKQVAVDRSIERYTRMNNYPENSRVVSKDDVERLGILTYFFSDASSAIDREVFMKLNGYDGKRLLTNEDMYIAYKIINNGYRIKYCADSVVIHSHNYSYKTLFKRYFDQAVFLKQNEYIDCGSNKSAFALLKFVLKNAIKEGNFKVLFKIIPNFGVRFIANKLGKKYENMSKEKILKYTSNKSYWSNVN